MLGIDLLLILVISLVLKDLVVTKLLPIIYIIYLALTYLISDSYLVGGLSSIINLLTNTLVNYAILLMSMIWWSNANYFFNKLNAALLILVYHTLTSILPNINPSHSNLVILKKSINLELYNGILSIHPIALLASIALASFTLVFSIVFLLYRNYQLHLYYEISPELSITRPCPILEYTKMSSKLRKITTLTLYINLISIILGAYWAHQELSWGGYWSWDPIEIFSLVALLVALILSHSVSSSPRHLILLLLFFLIFLIVLYVRLNIVSSIHGFIDSSDLRFSITNFIIILSPLSSLLMYWIRKPALIFFKNKSNLYTLAAKFYKSIIFYTNYLFFTSSLLYLISILLSNSIRPLSYNWFLTLILLFIICLFIKKASIFFIILPVLDATLLSLFFIFKKLTFSAKLIHFITLLAALFLLHYSHVFFIKLSINFLRELTALIPINITIISSLYSIVLNEIQSTYCYLLGCVQNRSVYVLTSSGLFDSLFVNFTEVFSTVLWKGNDGIYFGSNLFVKNTDTYPIFALSTICLLTYKLVGKNKKGYYF